MSLLTSDLSLYHVKLTISLLTIRMCYIPGRFIYVVILPIKILFDCWFYPIVPDGCIKYTGLYYDMIGPIRVFFMRQSEYCSSCTYRRPRVVRPGVTSWHTWRWMSRKWQTFYRRPTTGSPSSYISRLQPPFCGRCLACLLWSVSEYWPFYLWAWWSYSGSSWIRSRYWNFVENVRIKTEAICRFIERSLE